MPASIDAIIPKTVVTFSLSLTGWGNSNLRSTPTESRPAKSESVTKPSKAVTAFEGRWPWSRRHTFAHSGKFTELYSTDVQQSSQLMNQWLLVELSSPGTAGSVNEADSRVFHLLLNFTTTTRSGILSATWMWERRQNVLFVFLFHVFRTFVECMIIALSKGHNIAEVVAPWEHSKPRKDCRLELKTEVVRFLLFMKNIWFVGCIPYMYFLHAIFIAVQD